MGRYNMSAYMPMGTTIRHNKLITTLSSAVIDLMRKKEALSMQEECMLVHWGFKMKPDLKYLIDIHSISVDDIDKFKKFIMYELEYVQPDFFMFKKNQYLCNERETRIAGYPDLIVEVWSESNDEAEREFKFDLYSTSPVTEHWYIEQDSNEIICYFGKDKITNQYLTDVLVTLDGIEFDLRYLAL
jgi:hypothetical protein